MSFRTTAKVAIIVIAAEQTAGAQSGKQTNAPVSCNDVGVWSACLVSLQRFRGKMGGRRSTFVLQGSEIVENGKIKASWSVVPGSGTGELSGLRGEGGFEGDFGKGSDGTLDYWFE
jgi:hypothetical protein